MYEGKDICQACKRSGQESPRINKNNLCYDCQRIFDIGKFNDIEDQRKFASFFQHFHAYYKAEINHLAHKILSATHNAHAKNQSRKDPLKTSFGSNGKYYIIPIDLYEPLRDTLKDLDDTLYGIDKQKENLVEMAKKAIAHEKNEIFNQGVEQGRNLLFQLNNGEITPSQFAEKINKYS